jgi:histone H1/5
MQYAEEKYQLDLSGTNIYQLNRAIATGVEGGIFVLPKGPSGKVKLAPKAKAAAGASKEVCYNWS